MKIKIKIKKRKRNLNMRINKLKNRLINITNDTKKYKKIELSLSNKSCLKSNERIEIQKTEI